MTKIGPYKLKGIAVLAPMAGITDPVQKNMQRIRASTVTVK